MDHEIANPEDLDRDANGEPGGSLKAKVPLVDIPTGAIVVATAEVAEKRLKAKDARRATEADLEIAGRRDLIPLI